MRRLGIILIIFSFFLILGFEANSNAATSTGVFYWWSSSSSGYYGNDGVWRSWYSNPPAQAEHRYDMYSNVISWDGYTEQSRSWNGSVFYATDGHWKRRVDVTYYKPDPEYITGISLSKGSTTVNGLNTTGERIAVTASFSTGRSQDVTYSTSWQSDDSGIAWIANNDGTVHSAGRAGTVRVTASYSGKTAYCTVTVNAPPPPDTTPPATPTFTVGGGTNGSVIVTINYSSDSSVKLYKIGSGQYQNYYGPVTITSNTTIYAKAQDAAGNWSGESNYTVSTIDNSAPTGSIRINDNSQYSTNRNVTLSISASDNNGIVSQMIVGNDSGFGGAYWESYSAVKNWTLTSGDGTKTVYIKFKDSTGNESSVYSDSITLDTTPPDSPTFTPYTGNTGSMTLSINYTSDSAVKQYRLGNGSYTNYTGPINIYESTMVYAKAKDAAGNWSAESSYSASVSVPPPPDTTPPATPTFAIDSGANGSVLVTIHYSSDSVVKLYKIGSGQYQNYYGPVTITSNTTIYAKAQDVAGNWSAESNYSVTVSIPPPVDTTPPADPTFTVSSGANGSILVTINYYSDSYLKLYKIGTGQYQNYYGPITLTSNTTIYAKAQDAAGNWSGESSYTIGNIDHANPYGSVKINNDSEYTNSLNVTLNISASDSDSGIGQMTISNDSNFYGASWEAYTTSKNWTLTNGDGPKSVYVKFKDNSGNESIVYSDSITLDMTPPSKPTINSYIDMNGRTTLVISYPSDAVVKQYRIGNGAYQSYNDTFILLDNIVVYAKCQDAAGNWSEEASTSIGNIGNGDNTPPTGSVRINTNIYQAANLNVTLTINANDTGTGVSQMMISNDSNFSGANWESYYTSKAWVLSSYGDLKTVYIKFKDGAGNISSVYCDSVAINGYNPQIPAMPTVNFNPGVYYQPQWISLYSESGTIIRYTLDGNEPTEYSSVYTTPIPVYSTTNIKAKAYRNGFGSPTLSATYVIVTSYPNNNNYGNNNDSLTQAKMLYDQERYNEAIEMLKRLLNNDKKNEDELLLLLDCYGEQGDIYSAKYEIKQYITLYEYPRVVNRYAEICIDDEEYVEARNVIEDILPKYPNEIYLYRTLAKAYEGLNFEGIKVFVHGEEVDFSKYDFVYPIIIDGRTLIPIRALSEALGAEVDWSYSLRRANIYLDDKEIEIVDKSQTAKVDGISCRLDVPARIMGDRLMVPLRFISENFGKEVNWFEIGNDASIISVTEGEE